MKRLLPILLSLLAIGGGLAACGGDDGDKLTVYSGRNEKLIGDLVESFKKDTGVDVEVRYGDSAELAATIAEEGDASPADVFFSQDAGALGAVEQAGLLKALPQATLDKVDARWRDPKGQWVGTSGRSRVIAYSTERVQEGDVPDSVFDLTDPRYKGRIGLAPPNASFQAFVSAMRIDVGDAKTEEWLRGIKANAPKLLENNIQTEEAIARGEIDLGLVNHYYVYELRAERPDFPVANHFLKAGDPGALVNVAGAGILKSADRPREAQRFVDYLLAVQGQQYFADKTFEYPLVDGEAERPDGLPPIEDLQGPDIALGELGGKLKSTLEMLDRVGLSA
ncbi:MAG: iron ABC transporter substrate-binding protein [Solirubrobacterales bacterium]|nr:iron ABC transporter substrate-binding protein [Solirubrobacterales bacterium]